VVQATVTGSTPVQRRLRAYAWNGIGGVVPRTIGAEGRNARYFTEGLALYGCGGAILYAADPTDGSHTLEMVLVQ
jgi:hypothetical protein